MDFRVGSEPPLWGLSLESVAAAPAQHRLPHVRPYLSLSGQKYQSAAADPLLYSRDCNTSAICRHVPRLVLLVAPQQLRPAAVPRTQACCCSWRLPPGAPLRQARLSRQQPEHHQSLQPPAAWRPSCGRAWRLPWLPCLAALWLQPAALQSAAVSMRLDMTQAKCRCVHDLCWGRGSRHLPVVTCRPKLVSGRRA